MEKLYKNSHYLFIAVLLMVFAGFFKTYFVKFPFFEGFTVALHFHGIMVLLWLGMLIVQPILIKRNKLAIHRKVGKLSYLIFPLMVVSMIILIRINFMRNIPVPEGALDTNLIGIADMTFFIPCYALAMYFRKNTAYHSRLMVLSVLPFINPALGRLGLPGPILAIAIMIGLLIYEKKHNKVYLPYLIALPAYIFIYVFYLVLIDSDDWKAFWWMFF
ncbi:hypothetical protein [Algoriphagus sp. A40]|uniref:hypothetical protein n=1 Tax=Algoriphagus sp. A40 TaxID=1945863 RepID=UPI000986E077|nr:hypothetical protein [Algoriphagus sp. A40]OOG74928.1 hypothetical protein B0E43_11145 [Algoriphagus sp. A40]